MDPIIQIIITVLSSVLASSGLWAYLSKKAERKDLKTQMLVGLAHNQIMDLGMRYIKRGYITPDEYENLHDYLYVPYEKSGGNGSAKRIMEDVDRLEIRNHLQQEDDT